METATIKKPLIIIIGPTAVGKSNYAIEYARRHNGEIISADSMQVYRGMDIGTDKPPRDIRSKIPHHLIDIKNPDEDFSVAEFLDLAKEAISKIHANNKIPIVVGGTGMYLAALIEGFSLPIAKADENIRRELFNKPPLELFKRLQTVDPASAKKIHPNNIRRMVRALEVFELTGMPISKLQKKEPFIKDYKTKIIGLDMEREKLYKRINGRVDLMIKSGLVEEVKNLVSKYGKNNKSLSQALGYKEVIGYFDGKYNLLEMTEILKKNTRHFARRQLNWFKRIPLDSIVKYVL